MNTNEPDMFEIAIKEAEELKRLRIEKGTATLIIYYNNYYVHAIITYNYLYVFVCSTIVPVVLYCLFVSFFPILQ